VPFASPNSLFNTQSLRIQEILNKNVEVFLPALDPAWRDTTVSSQGVGQANLIGRDMKILKIYMGSMAGVLEMADSRSNFVLYGDNTVSNVADKLQVQSLTNTWPDATEGAMAQPYRLGIGMKAMVSNLLVTLGEMQAEATPAFIGEILAPKLEGHARLIAHTLCNHWYISDNSFYSLGSITAIDTATAGLGVQGANYSFAFTPGEGNIDRYAVGMRVDVYNAAGTTRRNTSGSNRVNAFVTRVDEVKNVVVVTYVSAGSALGTVNTDIIVYANGINGGVGSGIAGINSWLKGGDASGTTATNANSLLGADRDTANVINVNQHPEFKSYFKGSVGTLTEHKLRQYLRGFHRAKEKYGQYMDTLIAGDGVWLNYESQKIGQYQLDRTSKLSSLTNEGSQEGFKFTFDGRTYTGYTSNYIENGTVYGLRKGGANWKKYVPPSPKGTQKFDKAEAFIPFEFVAPALGYSTVKVPITKTSGTGSGNSLLTEGAQMPGMLRMQLVPDQPAGMKLTGVTFDKVYGD
jgi:hypothetical protein